MLIFDASGESLLVSDFCAIEAGSVGSNEGTFTPRNFLNAASWTSKETDKDDTAYKFYGYYPETGTKQSTYSSEKGGVLLNVPAAQTGEFGRYQICSSSAVEMTKAEVTKDKMVRFDFHPVTSLIRLRLTLSEKTDPSITEAYIKQVTLEAKGSSENLTGGCFLKFSDSSLTSTESEGTRKQITVTLPAPVKVTREKASNDYIDFVLLSTGDIGELTFDARLLSNEKVTVAPQNAPTEGFQAGVRYTLDRSITLVLDEDSDDSTYVDGGNAWDNDIDHDGFYTDAGYAW